MMEEKNLTSSDLTEEQIEILNTPSLPSQYYEYNLKGIVVHMGTADQGHYYSFIRDRENPEAAWYEFNDSLVTPFDPSEIPAEAFGGEDDSLVPSYVTDAQQAALMRVRIKNAYVLIYERQSHIDTQQFHARLEQREGDLPQAFASARVPVISSQQIAIPPQIHEKIL